MWETIAKMLSWAWCTRLYNLLPADSAIVLYGLHGRGPELLSACADGPCRISHADGFPVSLI